MDIEIKGLYKAYDKDILKAIDLKITRQRTVGIIGKSGCGKSTLLRIMTAIEAGDQGQVTINGHRLIKNDRTYQDHISMVFQNHSLFPHLSLLKNISLILEKRKKYNAKAAHQRARAFLTDLGLEDQGHKKPHQVSGGQSQRASIARALATDPAIIFMDEPTAALDPLLTREVLATVSKLKARGIDFVFVSHEINFVRAFADYVIFMDQGQVVEEGRVEILDHPKTKALGAFLSDEGSYHGY